MPIDAAAEIAHSRELLHAATIVGTCSRIEHDARAGVPGLLFAAHHEVAPAGGAAPMDPPYIVTLPVLPDQRVVLTHDANPMRSSVAGAAAAARCPDGRKRHDTGSHHHLAGRDELSIKLHKTEWINRSYRQRASGEAAAYPS